MNALTADTYPTLTVTAYASQLYKNATDEIYTLQRLGPTLRPNPEIQTPRPI